MVLGINLITVAACSKVQSFCGGHCFVFRVSQLRSGRVCFFSRIGLLLQLLAVALGIWVVLGILFITAAACSRLVQFRSRLVQFPGSPWFLDWSGFRSRLVRFPIQVGPVSDPSHLGF